MVASLKADAIRHETHFHVFYQPALATFNLSPVCLHYLGAVVNNAVHKLEASPILEID